MGEARWDPHGTHLAAGCAWVCVCARVCVWRTKRYDDIATMVVGWINAGGRQSEHMKEPSAHSHPGESQERMAVGDTTPRCTW